MPSGISLTQSSVFTALKAFLQANLAAGTTVRQAQLNRIPEPLTGNYVLMTPLGRPRLATNITAATETQFAGSIAGTLLTSPIALSIGTIISAVGVQPGTVVTGIGPSGGTTYTVSASQTLSAQTLYAGIITEQVSTQFDIQLDVHGQAGTGSSADNAQIISTLFRSAYGCDALAAAGVAPLYTSDPRQMPFINGEGQYEERWVIDISVQINPIVTVPQQFAGTLTATPIDVETAAL